MVPRVRVQYDLLSPIEVGDGHFVDQDAQVARQTLDTPVALDDQCAFARPTRLQLSTNKIPVMRDGRRFQRFHFRRCARGEHN